MILKNVFLISREYGSGASRPHCMFDNLKEAEDYLDSIATPSSYNWSIAHYYYNANGCLEKRWWIYFSENRESERT